MESNMLDEEEDNNTDELYYYSPIDSDEDA